MTYLFVTRRSWSMLADDSLDMPITDFILRAMKVYGQTTTYYQLGVNG